MTAERKTFKLAHAIARGRAMEAVKTAPEGYVVIVCEATRGLDANAHLHAWISAIAKSIEWAGAKRDIETWKRLLTAAWLRARGDSIEMLPAIDGHGFDVLFQRTSHLKRGEFSELTEFVIAWAVDNGVEA